MSNTNAEIIIQGLQELVDGCENNSIAGYIACPSSNDCTYDGNDNSPCTKCKIKWLKEAW